MNSVYITNLASFLPNAPVGNDSVEAVLGKLEHMPTRTKRIVLRNNGIKTRHYAIDPETHKMTHTNSQLTAEAVRSVLKAASMDKKDVQGLACGTSCPDQMVPAHSLMVAGELGLPPCEVVSTAGVCCSGMTALKYAYMNVALGLHQNFISTGSELVSPYMVKKHYHPIVDASQKNPEKTPMLGFEKEFLRWMLSDGAGALLLENKPREDEMSLKIEWVDTVSWAGELPTCMYMGMNKDGNGTFRYWYEEDRDTFFQKGYMTLQQDTQVLQKHMLDCMILGTKIGVERYNLDFSTIDWFLPHLSSMFFYDYLHQRFKQEGINLPKEKWFLNLPQKGNTGSASIYIMLDELFHSGRLSKGDRILCGVPESARFTAAGMLLTVC